MEYTILKNTNDEFFIEIDKNSFRTKIIFDFNPNDDFKGLAIGCSYNYKGKPIGFLKDNGLIVNKIQGKSNRPIFYIDDTIVQAGPTLIENFEPVRKFKEEGFSSHDILAGLHVHIGQKKFGNYIVGFTKKATLAEITEKYKNYNIQNAIKLPGLKQAGFYFKSSHQIIKEGNLPMPVALCFEPRLKEIANLLSQVV